MGFRMDLGEGSVTARRILLLCGSPSGTVGS